MKRARVIISVGGSLIAPHDIDVSFLKRLRTVLTQFSRTHTFALICGGGATARTYQAAAPHATHQDKDWLGIYATRLNALLLWTLLKNTAHPNIITDPRHTPRTNKTIIAAGWKPGWSTDYDAVMLAHKLNAKTVINLSNTDAVYTADPRTHKKTKPIADMTWKQYLNMIPKKWTPGMNCPFDPVASRLAAKKKINVIIMNGKALNRFMQFLKTGRAQGTIVHP